MASRLSPRAVALFNALEDRRRLLDRIRGAKGPHREELLLELGATGEPAVIPGLMRFVLPVVEGSELRATALALHHLAASLGPKDVLAVEEVLRSPGWQAEEYREHSPRGLSRYAGQPPVVFALLSCHPNGYVREAALRGLHGRDAGPAWPFLLLRLNDWVRQVREAALAAAEEALERIAPEPMVRHLSLLLRLREGARGKHEAFVARVLERLRSSEGRPVLREHLGTLRGAARRVAYQLLLEGSPADVRTLLELALEDPDTVLRRWAAERLTELFRGEALREVLARLERSRFMPVRREAYVLYAQRFPELAGAKLREALVDRNRAIREYAQLRLAGAELAGFYRESLREGPQLPGVLAGLGETGRAPDAAHIEPFLQHPRVRVRHEAVRAYARLAGQAAVERLRECFADSSPSVSRAAAAELRREPGRVSVAWLRRWLVPGTPPHLAFGALGLMDALPKWDAPLVPLAALAMGNAALTDRAHRELRNWSRNFNQDFTQPTRAQLQELKAGADAAPGLEPALRADFEHLFRTFGPV
jgi:HEAT repeat protein